MTLSEIQELITLIIGSGVLLGTLFLLLSSFFGRW